MNRAERYLSEDYEDVPRKTVYIKNCCVYNLGYKIACISPLIQVSINKIIILHNFVKRTDAFFGDIAKYNMDVYVF